MSNFSKENRPGGSYMLGGKEVSRVGYGTMQLPKLKDEAKARKVIRKAYELIKMRDEGKIEAIGLSTVSLKELQSAQPAGIVCVQNQYNITSRSQESILELCKKEKIAWVPYFPLGGGLPGSAKVTEDKTVQAVAKEMGISPVQVGLAWILQHADNALIIEKRNEQKLKIINSVHLPRCQATVEPISRK